MILFPKFLLELGLLSKAGKNVVGGNPVLRLSSRSAREAESVTSLGRFGILIHGPSRICGEDREFEDESTHQYRSQDRFPSPL